MADVRNDRLVWIDLEMTGLDPVCDHVIEIATIVTDSALKVLAVGPVIAIHRSESELARMDEEAPGAGAGEPRKAKGRRVRVV